MTDAHIPLIEQAGKEGLQVLCFQEVFTQPYFCPSQDTKWYGAAEDIPKGPTGTFLKARAHWLSMAQNIWSIRADKSKKKQATIQPPPWRLRR
tara:strand:+ start:1706 stop:1984 length:279 start_codon:yes stop_codon:yes gene_type:complete